MHMGDETYTPEDLAGLAVRRVEAAHEARQKGRGVTARMAALAEAQVWATLSLAAATRDRKDPTV